MKKYLFSFFIFLMTSLSLSAQEIAASANEICPLKIGSQIPDVSLKDIDGHTVRLYDLLSQKPTVIIFYRGSWCPYCNLHLASLQKAEEELLNIGIQILAISPDLPENLKKSVDKHNLTYTLLSDSDLNLIKQMGLAFRLSEETLARYEKSNIDLEGASGETHHSLPVPAAYLVDQKGLVHFNYVNPNYRTRISPEVLLSAARGLVEE